MIRVLIVESALPVALVLKSYLAAQPGLSVVGHASRGGEALQLLRTLRPDVVTMDLRLPDMDGIETTRRIMEEQPTPIVMVGTALDKSDTQTVFRALEAGAVAVFGRPPLPGDPQVERVARELGELLHAMAGAQLVRRRRVRAVSALAGAGPMTPAGPRVLAIAASTGGPLALAAILGGLPAGLPLPVLVVQHISPGFLPGMVDWLGTRCGLVCRVATDGEALQDGTVYFAPDGHHLRGASFGNRLFARLAADEPVQGHRPSATPLFASVAQECGARAIGVVLTGMGADGAQGLLALRDAGALTLAQSPETCVIDGMPLAAMALSAASEVVPLSGLAARILLAAGVDVVPGDRLWGAPTNFSALDATPVTAKDAAHGYDARITAACRGDKQ